MHLHRSVQLNALYVLVRIYLLGNFLIAKQYYEELITSLLFVHDRVRR